jgi:FHS family L-fucose permease-like MFS transporter
MTCGLAFLETTANPYILSMGAEETATRRLNLSQAFNPMGSLLGMFTARELILARLNPATEAERLALRDQSADLLTAMQRSDLDVVSMPYLVLGLVVLAFFVLFALVRLPDEKKREAGGDPNSGALATLRRLLKNSRYVGGVVAQTFYVGAQIMVWTFIIQYAEHELGMAKATAQTYNIAAMMIFVSSRFICTFLLKYIKPSALLLCLAVGGCTFTLGAIFVQGMAGLYSLVAVSACMSLMGPTIYGIALRGMGGDAKLGSAGLILAIGGGCLMPPLQGLLMDKATWLELLSSVRISFVLPLLCFVVIALYGYKMMKPKYNN